MIKVLFIHNKLVCGGAEQALYDLLCLMDKTKFDITLLVQYDGGIWEDKFRDAGFNIISIWDCQKVSRNPLMKVRNWYKRKQIVQALERDGEGLLKACGLGDAFDLIVAYNGSTLQKMCFSGQAKTVKYIHGDVGTNELFRKNTLAIRPYLERFARIICVSEIAKKSFVEVTGISENVLAYHNPLNSDNIARLSQAEVDMPSDVPLICAVGRLSEEKGFDRLIRIHKRLYDEGLRHKLVLVGDGPERESLEETIRSIHAEDSVIMVGYQGNPYPYIKISSFLVCPSYTEGLSIVAMEALFLGIPVVASVPTIGELFGDEKCGLITENDDASLEAGVRRMLTDAEFYNRAKGSALRRSTYFDGHRMVREIEEEFISLIEGN